MSVEVEEFFTRLVKELGYEIGSEIEGLFIRFNGGVVIEPKEYTTDFSFSYRFPEYTNSSRYTWGFARVTDLMVSKISYRNAKSRISRKKPGDFDVFIDLSSWPEDIAA